MKQTTQRTYVLSSDWSFRFTAPDKVQGERRGSAPIYLPRDQWLLLSELTTPRSVADLYEDLELDVDADELGLLLDKFVEFGVLISSAKEDHAPSIWEIMRPNLTRDPNLLHGIGAGLRAGRLVTIRDAFDPAFAERVHSALTASTAWKVYEEARPDFYFRHHNLYMPEEFPEPVREAKTVFDSSATRATASRLSGVDCEGETVFGASWHQPGDHQLPHTDAADVRSVAWVWHLTKDWDTRWGGHLVWCPTGTLVAPSFNTLHMFVVTRSSLHFVSTVAPCARGSRFAVNGWWCKRPAEADDETGKATESPDSYRRRPEPIGDGVTVL